ncbi:uncharacterized protein [Ptychodera flava]|uniref:uncharacterized protein isoform X2 n=1 Tax=Ptychodera flava TaxID=63121 RepID=UPI00396A1DA4
MHRSLRSPKRKVHFMSGMRMASSHENLAGLDMRDLTSDADISMESLSPIMQVKSDRRSTGFRRLPSSTMHVESAMNDSGNGLDNIIAELDEGIAELTDQPHILSSQNSTLTSKSNSSAHSQLPNKFQGQLETVEEILRNARQSAAMEFQQEQKGDKVSPADRLRQSMSQQIPVKHCSSKGTQCGMLLPKYHTRGESKCIRCKDCGIFYTPASFLKHFHDQFGRREDCDALVLQLNVENPTGKEIRLWEEFQLKISQKSPRKRPAVFTDSLMLSKCRRQNNIMDVSGIQEEEEGKVFAEGEFSDGFNPPMTGITMDDSVLSRHSGTPRRERRPSAPGLLIRKAVSTTDLDKASSFQNKPVIMGSQPKNSNPRSKKNTLQKYLPLDMIDVTRMSTDPAKMNLRSQGSLRRSNSLSNISSIANGTFSPVERNESLQTSKGLHPADIQQVLPNLDKEDPLYILQTAQELISLATNKLGNSGDSVWAEKLQQERTLRQQAEERVKHLERLLQEEKRRREILESEIRTYKTQINS